MNALKARKKYDAEQIEKAYKEREQQREELIRNMTEEERVAYMKEEEQKKKEIASLIASMALVNSTGPYKL